MATIHAEVSNDSNMEKSHETIDKIERDVLKEMAICLVIHMDPVEVNDKKILDEKNMVKKVVNNIEPKATIHYFRVVNGENITNFIFDLVVPHSYKEKDEQNLLLKVTKNISEINEILLSKDEDAIDNMLLNRYRKLHDDINNLVSLRNIISSIIRIKNQNGIQKISIYQILKEQIYIHKKYEGVFNVSQFVGDLVVVEFGIGLVESADYIIENIRNLRNEIKNELNKEIPLVRIKDNTDLTENEYRIMIKDIIVRKEVLESVSSVEKATLLANGLKESLLSNIKNIIE
jgi:hypothetical protein